MTDSAWPLAEPLDDYLREVVVTLRQATERGIRNIGEHPPDVERTLSECKEMLDVILAGDVRAWLTG